MDSATDTLVSEKEKPHTEAVVRRDGEHDKGDMPENSRESSCSSSTSSDSSSDDDFFQIEPSSDPQPLQHGTSAQSLQSGEVKIESESIVHGSQTPKGRQFSPASSSGSPELDNSITLGAKQSPPAQVMTKYDVPDPNRIPSSVFARSKSNTPMEWSVASNESLFSIHIGNSSFSRDHVFLLGRSGELTNFSNSQIDGYPPLSPPIGSSSNSGNAGVGLGLEQPGAAEAANAEAMKDVLRAAAEGQAEKDKPSAEGPGRSGSTSRHSDCSATSFRSFAFPILEGRSGSVKVEAEHQSQQMATAAALLPQRAPSKAETPKAAPSTGEGKWFSWFSCCPSCC